MNIKEQQERLQAYDDIIIKAIYRARDYGKIAEPKRPIIPQLLSLTIRNIDENSRDEAGSVNSIQVAMDVAVMAAEKGMESSCYKSSGNLILQISPKIKEQS